MHPRLHPLRPLYAAALLAGIVTGCQPQAAATDNPVEVGTVQWGRDFDAALVKSQASGKPVFLLFQEVPGCSGCKDFGREVLSDPEIVRAIEGNFVPLLIHNNKPGRDAEVLERFGEPAWNFQVVRFLNGEGKDLIPRKDRVWTAPALSGRMAEALEKAGRNPLPATERVAFSQHCFWTGEMKLGAIDGTLRTEAGFIGGSEVTVVDFDPAAIRLEELIRAAKKAGVAEGIYLTDTGQANPAKAAGLEASGILGGNYRKAPPSDQKRQLAGTRFADLELTPEQATKVNAFARSDPKRAMEQLTADQRREIE